MNCTPFDNSSTSTEELSLLQMLRPEVLANPAPLYHRLRAAGPVLWDPYMHAWIVTGYNEVVTVLMQFSADRTPTSEYLQALDIGFMTPFADMMRQQMLFMDSPAHTRLRTLCSAAFTPRKMEALRASITSVCDRLLDRFIESGSADLVRDFAAPLPAIVTAKLLGVPERDHAQLGAWVLDIAEVLGNFQHHPDRVGEIVLSLRDLKTYMYDRLAEQRACPTEGLLSSLSQAEVDGQRLTDEEVVANTIITLIGGHETTTNLIASGFRTLIQQPAALEQLRSRPEIIRSAVEELLRFEAPVQHTARIAPADVELGGCHIRKGSRVVAGLAAANRDPARFSNPDELDLERTDNRHLAFGWAAHFCFGAPLARVEAQIAFNTLLRRLREPALRATQAQWRENAGLRGLTSLPISFRPGQLVCGPHDDALLQQVPPTTGACAAQAFISRPS